MKPNLCFAGVLYNAWEPGQGRREEQLSEQAVEKAADQAAEALTKGGYRTALFPVRGSLVEILDRVRTERPDVIVNLCEGFRGRSSYEAQVAGLLELLGIPFTGNSSRALALCQDKFRTKAVLQAWGLPTPRGWLVETAEAIPDIEIFPLIVKPNAEDASIGIGPQSVVRDPAALRRQVERLNARYAQSVLIEEYIDGRELNVALVEDSGPRVLPLSEILFQDFPEDMPRVVGYEAKWLESHVWYQRTAPVCPAPVADRLAEELRRLALEAYKALGVRGYARLDFRVDCQDRPFLLEVNPNPDTSREAGWAQSLAAAGISYEAFWHQQVQWAMNKSKVERGRSKVRKDLRPLTCPVGPAGAGPRGPPVSPAAAG